MQAGLNPCMPEPEFHSLGARVAHVRNLRGLSQEDLAKSAGISQGTISKIEIGTSEGSRHLLAIAKALSCNPFWLDTGDGSIDMADWMRAGQPGVVVPIRSARPSTGVADVLMQLWRATKAHSSERQNTVMGLIREMVGFDNESRARATAQDIEYLLRPADPEAHATNG